MKAVFVFLFICLTWGGKAETSVPYTPDSLKKGDFLIIESTHYYPDIAPGIKEKLPWRVENIRRAILRATVTDKNNDAATFEFTVENLYDCRNDGEKPGFFYFDSRYRQDFAFEDSLPGKRIAHVTFDLRKRNALAVDKTNLSYSYAKTYVPFGVKREEVSYNPVAIVRDSLDMDKLLTPVIDNLLTGWKKDGTILLPQDTRVIGASFSLPPNTEFTCHYFDQKTTSKVLTVHKKIFIPYPTEYEVARGVTLLLTPGDSITQDKDVLTNAHLVRYQGRGNEQNNFQYSRLHFANKPETNIYKNDIRQPEQLRKAFQVRDSVFQDVMRKDFGKMDPYWRKVFERSDQYLKGGSILSFFLMEDADKEAWHKSGLLDLEAPHFASINPLIDFGYSLKNKDAANYGYFLYFYAAYKKQELKRDNLSLNKQKALTPQENYLLNKQILSGYPKYLVNGTTLIELMRRKPLSEIDVDYNDFIFSCPDTFLTNPVKEIYDKFLPFEPGNNIRETGLMITDSLRLVKGSDRKYILLYLTTGTGLPAWNLQDVFDWQQLLQKEGLASTVQLKPYGRFASHNAAWVKPYEAIPEEQLQDLNNRLGLYSMAILMREDGTILHRQFALTDKKTILDIIRRDMNRPEHDNGLLNFVYGCITAFLLAIFIHYLYRRRIRAKLKQEQIHLQIRELELRAIRSQMNPHFIFNALSSIQNLINRSANKEAGDYLVNFSRLLRMVLATSEKKLVALSDEIEQLQLYIKLEQLRFPFSYSLFIDENIEPELIEIPSMLIQPFVENAVKHGIAPRGAGEVDIRVSSQNQRLVIDITDDGPGIQTGNEHSGFGMRAISHQIEILKAVYNTEIDIEIENRQDKEASVTGCHIRLSIPI